ncbi:MAG: hypothetical protein Q9160_004825 [Pyrenula sp. 1 TL-2023]
MCEMQTSRAINTHAAGEDTRTVDLVTHAYLKMLRHLFIALYFNLLVEAFVVNNATDCYVYPESLTHFGQPVDDTPSILQAFELCGTNGSVTFTNYTFHVDQVMTTTDLLNCNVYLQGELQYSTNIPYWLSHSINVGLQNQSTAWLFGGQNVTFKGQGGFINGNGQAWYTQNRNNSNEPGRPISITFFNSTNLFVDQLTIIQPQFWATFVTYSNNVTMSNVFVNATSNDEWGTVNTDGTDTWNSRDILLENWTVQNGDDCIAAKGNTTNLLVRNVTCYNSNGMTIGSVGQYPPTPDYVENVVFEDVRLINSIDGAYIKTWQGTPQDNTGNGDSGGGGSGYVRNVTFRNFEVTNVGLPIQISQCIYSENAASCGHERFLMVRKKLVVAHPETKSNKVSHKRITAKAEELYKYLKPTICGQPIDPNMTESPTKQGDSSSARPASNSERISVNDNRNIGLSAYVDPLASLSGTNLITVSDAALILPRVQLNASHGPLHVGPGSMICEKVILGQALLSGSLDSSDKETRIGANSRIEGFARIAPGVSIGEASIIDSHVTLEEDVKIGTHSKICHHVTLTRGTVVGDWEIVTETTNGASGALGTSTLTRKRQDDEAGQKAEEYRLRAFRGEREGLLTTMKRTKAAEDQRKRQSARPPAKKS